MVQAWRFFTVAILVSMVAIVVMGPARAADTPTDVVRTTVNEAISVLQDQGLKTPDRAAERIKRLKKLADSRFDYGEMTKRSLGAHWNKMSEGEQTEFVDLFTKLLTATYADKIGSYSGEQVKYLEDGSTETITPRFGPKWWGKQLSPSTTDCLRRMGSGGRTM